LLSIPLWIEPIISDLRDHTLAPISHVRIVSFLFKNLPEKTRKGFCWLEGGAESKKRLTMMKKRLLGSIATGGMGRNGVLYSRVGHKVV